MHMHYVNVTTVSLRFDSALQRNIYKCGPPDVLRNMFSQYSNVRYDRLVTTEHDENW